MSLSSVSVGGCFVVVVDADFDITVSPWGMDRVCVVFDIGTRGSDLTAPSSSDVCFHHTRSVRIETDRARRKVFLPWDASFGQRVHRETSERKALASHRKESQAGTLGEEV